MADSLSELLGIDLDELEWQDLVVCSGMDINQFYDDYESDDNVARITDQACLSCPVMSQCLREGIENSEWGVWGAIYLVNGKVDKNRNSHKTKEVWDEIKEKIGDTRIQ
jgi:hypothetical protein